MVHGFWKRWHLEYLTTLQVRNKWCKESPNIEIGTVVVLKNDNSPPLYWPLAVVTAVHPGKDQRVRVVTVKTSKGTFLRPIVKICPLPTQPEGIRARIDTDVDYAKQLWLLYIAYE
ncbi:hypothetical protein NQ317_017055 [Molorchus minor]|uniref:DUF5641 domain-containing protein n=1 Tax=Molorchus minor TaxID=1323400 RepID=A0ABQ9K4Z2_9CUCU|nr:hypothetical protein NQ317_017055 [Molorchus minor]